MPLDHDTILPDDQFLHNPVADAKTWAETALVSPMSVTYGIKPLTHPNALIKTSTGEVRIEYECKFPLEQFISVELRQKQGNVIQVVTGEPIKEQVRLIQSENQNIILTRFTQHGDFHVELWVQ